jgi:DoxX-like family
MTLRGRVVRVLAILQAVDFVGSQAMPQFGDAHLDHLGVPQWLRPLLPATKAAAVVALVATRERPKARSAVGAALVAYYASAVTFHLLSGDGPDKAAPAAAFGALAAVIV